MNIEEAFRSQIQEKLGASPSDIVADGKLHRFATLPHGRDDAGFYVLHDDSLPVGSFGDWRTGSKYKWTAKAASKLTPEEKKRLGELKAIRHKREEDSFSKATASATLRWQNAKPASDDHPYLKSKGVGAHGLREAHLPAPSGSKRQL